MRIQRMAETVYVKVKGGPIAKSESKSWGEMKKENWIENWSEEENWRSDKF
jgi:hypothetical protein